MKLYAFDWGMYPRRVLVYLKERAIDIAMVHIDVLTRENRQPEFLSINPAGTLPVLELPGGEYVRQSRSIIEYMEDTYPDGGLGGRTPGDSARIRDLQSFITEAYNAFNLYCYHTSPVFAGLVAQSGAVSNEMFDRHMAAMDTLERLASGGPFLLGDRLTHADCAFFASAQFACDLYRFPLSPRFPKLRSIYDTFSTRPSARGVEYPPAVLERAGIPPR
ncbi:MAG: glutathione S-transferase family protein [Myxococcota bacterium]